MFIIDLDNTLMDTHGKFRNARIKALEKIGVSRDLYDETRKDAHDGENGEGIYDNSRHAKALALFGFDEKKVYEALMESLKPEIIKTCLYPDAIDFLKKIKKIGKPIILLTFGNPIFQEQKIKALDLEKYFDRMIFTNQKKTEKLTEIMDSISSRPAWFINDRIVENLEAKKLFSELKVAQTVFPFVSEDEYQSSGLPYFKTLTEIYDFITK